MEDKFVLMRYPKSDGLADNTDYRLMISDAVIVMPVADLTDSARKELNAQWEKGAAKLNYKQIEVKQSIINKGSSRFNAVHVMDKAFVCEKLIMCIIEEAVLKGMSCLLCV